MLDEERERRWLDVDDDDDEDAAPADNKDDQNGAPKVGAAGDNGSTAAVDGRRSSKKTAHTYEKEIGEVQPEKIYHTHGKLNSFLYSRIVPIFRAIFLLYNNVMI